MKTTRQHDCQCDIFRTPEFASNPFEQLDACFETLAGDLIESNANAPPIANAHYQPADPEEVAAKQTHLTPEQRADLANLLRKFPRLFNGHLGLYPHKKVHLELLPNAQPVHRRPYDVPHSQLQVFQNALDMYVHLGILEPCGASEWGLPTFIIPKKDGTVRWVSDMRELNIVMKRKGNPLPWTVGILQQKQNHASRRKKRQKFILNIKTLESVFHVLLTMDVQ